MKQSFLLILVLYFTGHAFAQQDKNGNPVFNSIVLKEVQVGEFVLHSNYYTLKNNIEHPQSSVFISAKPTLDQIEDAAVGLPSDFFILTKESRTVVLVTLLERPGRQFMVIEMNSGEQSLYPCTLKGDITENRAKELMQEKYDPAATLRQNKLTFHGKQFVVIPEADIEAAVLDLIAKEQLDKLPPSQMIIPSQEELKTFILSESKEGGKLDFFTEIKGKENDGVQIKPGVFSTNRSVALYKWGRACFEIGVNTVADAQDIYAAFQGRAVSEREKDYIRMGFFKEWEQ